MNRYLFGVIRPVLDFSRPVKRGFVFAIDAGLCVFSVWLAFYLRVGTFLPLFDSAFWPALVSVC